MKSKKMEDALNGQVNAELYSSYMYLSMASYLESVNMSGMSNWMVIQAQEEVIHAMKIFDYVIERGGRAVLKAIEAPPTQWKSVLDVFESAYEHEQKVTGLIHGLVDLAQTEKDHATFNFLQWFVEEQVEEESSADAIVQKLKLIGDSRGPLYMLDKELGLRPPKFPPAESSD